MTVYSSLEYGSSYCMAQFTDLPNTDCCPLFAGGHLSAHDQNNRRNMADHQKETWNRPWNMTFQLQEVDA